MTNGRPGSPATNPKIDTFFSPKRSAAAVLPTEEEEQVDQPSEPILPKLVPLTPGSKVAKLVSKRGPASRTISTAASVKVTAPALPPASGNGFSSIFQDYIVTAAAAPVPSGPPKVDI